VYQFKNVKEVLAKANEEKSGDRLAGIIAESMEERIAAKHVLANLTVADLRNNPVIPYEQDEVTRIIQDDVNERIYSEIAQWTLSDLREWILCDETSGDDIKRVSRGLTSEVVAGVAKLMTNLDLVYGASKIRIQAHCNTTIGLPGTLSARLQPNHPTDSPAGIKASIFEGLSYGSGDCVIGINPSDDSLSSVSRLFELTHDVITAWEIPTQNSVLAHITTQREALKRGAPVSMLFQSLAGSEKANQGFGISVGMLDEAYELAKQYCNSTGPNYFYFETGQGTELSANAHEDTDQLTMEARCYGLAKRYQPFIVNTVVGFIGPEYLYDSVQITRAGLEDHFMGKLTGIPMGCDACYTNHAKATQNDIENLAVLLTSAGCCYFIGVALGDDIMLSYQCTSYHDTASLRQLLGLRPIPEFEAWMENLGLMKNGILTEKAGDASFFLGR